MTSQQVREYLQRVTYKPGWRMTVEPWRDTYGSGLFHEPQLKVQFTFNAECAVTGKTDNQVSGVQLIEPAFIESEHQLNRLMLDFILRIERHEAQEFFKVDGVAPFYPH